MKTAAQAEPAKSRAVAAPVPAAYDVRLAVSQLDQRLGTIAQRQQLAAISTSPQVQQATTLQRAISTSPRQQAAPVQRRANNTGLPDHLKAGVENLSGHSLDDVRVHYNSAKPAQLQAHAYAQGTEIHIAPGQEKHLPHEAWHVVQQKQGRVQPTKQLKGKVAVNDDAGLEKEADVMGSRAAASLGASLNQIQLPASVSQRVVQRIAYDEAVVGKSYKVDGTSRKLVSKKAGWLRFEGLDKAMRAADVEEISASSSSSSRGARFGKYDSDDEVEMSDGEDMNLYRANKDASHSVKMHSIFSTSEQSRVSIREMRNNKPLTNPQSTIARMGSQFLEFAPTPARKDFGVSHMRPTEDGTALQRSGSPRSYDVLGKDLDKSATRCSLSMSQMNEAIRTLLFTNPDTSLAGMGLPTMDKQCLADLRELVAILALDIARSHNGRKAIEAELLGNTSSFATRIGGAKPAYGGAQNMKKHGMGGVQYLKQYDEDDDEEMS